MNYSKIYDSIISKALSRVRPNCYCEKHHILPKSMGGSDDKTNIAILTAREHFIAHWLLYKIHKNKSMALAFFSMSKPVGNGRKRYSSHSFKYAREAGAMAVSEMKSGDKHHMFGLVGASNPNFGSKRTDETRMKLSEIAKKRTGGKNHKAKKVICITTGEIFDSISCAKKKHRIGNINYSIKTGGTAGGLVFSYYENGNARPHSEPLGGYASGSSSWNSVKVKNETTGQVFETIAAAAKSISVSSPAVRYAINNKSICKGNRFSYYEG